MKYDYDVIVIGAGIHGAGAAQAAAAAGYSVLALEQFEKPAQGTSGRSSKLIHGGLRYLETAQLKLVYECLNERDYLLKNAPHLVKLVPFHIPVYKKTTRRPWKIMAGLSLYTLFSHRKFNRIPRSRWDQLDGLTTTDLDAVFCYYDAQTDDARLTRAVLSSAQSLGADIRMNTRFESARLLDHGCELTCSHSGHNKDESNKVSARVLINTAGPWVNEVLERIDPSPEKMAVKLVQGSHILVPGNVKHPYYLESPQDRRAVFVTPWKSQVLIGTTENDYDGDPADVYPLTSEISYLLDIYNFYFNKQLKPGDVIDAFAGLRVLPEAKGSIFDTSRDTFFGVDNPGKTRVISVYGGKLTSYRATSEKLINKLKRVLPKRNTVADTKRLKLPIEDKSVF